MGMTKTTKDKIRRAAHHPFVVVAVVVAVAVVVIPAKAGIHFLSNSSFHLLLSYL
jgi:hypothetical protein